MQAERDILRIHSMESFGTVDGPGLRFVVFMQGCPLRCLYCHNPDTWETGHSSLRYTPQELVVEVERYKGFIRKGGVTVTGGEPLLQAGGLSSFFHLCHSQGIHTALDTSGCVWNADVETLLKHTDLVLLDIKAFQKELYRSLTTTATLQHTMSFLDKLRERGVAVWIRHVVVPGHTDNAADWQAMATYLHDYENVQRIELLPYHLMGANKYDALGKEYPLKGVPPCSPEVVQHARAIFRQYSGKDCG